MQDLGNNTPLLINELHLADVQGKYFYDTPWIAYSEILRTIIKRDLERCAAGETLYRKIKGKMGARGLRWLSFSAHPVRDENQKITHLIVESRDINREVSEIQETHAELFEEKERLQVTLHSIGDAVITTDAKGIIDYMNPVAESLTGWDLQEALGLPSTQVFNIIKEEDRQPSADPVSQCLDQGRAIRLNSHTILINRHGREYYIQDSAAPIRGRNHKILGVVLIFSDCTQSRGMLKQLAYHASHDPLTALVNRREFELRLTRILKTAKQMGHQHALCYLDLDRFKIVNDSCGHMAGDDLLRIVSEKINACIRSRDTLARLGGDEFGILIEHCTSNQALQICEKICQEVNSLDFTWQGRSFSIGVSIGMVAIANTEKCSSLLLSDADAACYVAKRSGRGRVRIYQENDIAFSQQRKDLEWLKIINQALEKDQFCLYFQPIQSLNLNQGMRYEFLLRLHGQQDGIITPERFLPAAEQYGLSRDIHRWVLKKAFHWLSEHQQHLAELDFCTINLSGHSLSDELFQGFLIDLFDSKALPKQKLCLEITEAAAIANIKPAQELIHTLQALGYRFALDDFGDGFSSFSYLKSLPVNYLKIDGGFVRNITCDSDDLAIVKSINDIAHTMGKQTIAESVEHEQCLHALVEIGVDFVQGDAVGKPQPLEMLHSVS